MKCNSVRADMRWKDLVSALFCVYRTSGQNVQRLKDKTFGQNVQKWKGEHMKYLLHRLLVPP